MARLSLLVTLVILTFVLMTLTEVQGRKGKGRRKRFQDDRGHGFMRKRKDQADRHRRRDLWSDYHELDPLSFFNFKWNMEMSRKDPWWEGPNVCEKEEEEFVNNTEARSEMMRHFQTSMYTCDELDTAYKCKMIQQNLEGRKEVTIIYECCHGYTRQKGDFGCPQRVSMKNIVEKAQELGLSDFVKAVKTLKLTRSLETGNFTVFVPENGAFSLDSDLIDSGAGIILKDAPSVIAVSEPAVDKALESLQNAIMGHVIYGTVRSSSMEDEEVLKTANPEDATIRINYFTRPEKLMTANCIPVVSRDHMATNGVIHTVEKVLKPVTNSLLDIVRTRQELSTLKTVLAAAEYVSALDEDGQLTLLAPTNDAFERMNPRLRERLLRGDQKCLQNVLKNHLLPNTICSRAIQGNARTPNLLHKYLNVSRTEDDKVFVGGAQVVQADEMATNGVLHLIDEVLVPEEALSFLDVIEKEGYTELLNLVEKAGLTKTLETLPNATVFVPTNEAIQSLPAAVKTKLSQEPDLLREVLTFHVSPEMKDCRHAHNNQLYPTVAGPDVRINAFSMFPFHHGGKRTAQCVPIERMNLEACNGHVNVISGVMLPPQGNVVDVLALNKDFSTLVSLVKKAGLADSLQEDGPFTVFAPNNEAFEALDQDILNDMEKLQTLLKRHVIQDTLCCAGIVRGHWFGHQKALTLSGESVKLSRDRDNVPKIGHASVVKCDSTATNGNVLEIDRVLVHEPPRQRWRFNPFAHWKWDDFYDR